MRMTGALSTPGADVEIRVRKGNALAQWRHGAAQADTDTVVFLDARVRLSPHWLEPLLSALEEPHVTASGPYFPALAQPEDSELQTHLAMISHERQALRKEFRQWQQHGRPRHVVVEELQPACVAVRTSAVVRPVEAGQEFDPEPWETGTLADLAQAGQKVRVDNVLAVLDQTLAATWVRRPFVSGCLIVRDEEANLPACLASLQGLVDEVVVYDTGSTDDTIAVARAAGAHVIEGYWDDDFSRARNAAKEYCKGRWILWVDADERVIGNPVTLRRRLMAPPNVEAYNVTIENLMGSGAGARAMHVACRVFLRDVAHWEGRLHEQVQGPGGRRLAPVEHLEDIRLEHRGYLNSVMQERDKTSRNIRLAQAELDAPGVDRSYALMNLGRSLLTAGRFQEAADVCEQALGVASNLTITRVALQSGIDALTALKRLDEALVWIQRLRAASSQRVLSDILEARVRAGRGELQTALDLLAPFTTTQRDDDGFEYTPATFAAERAIVLEALGQSGPAADAMLAALASQGVLDAHLGKLVRCLHASGRRVDEIGRAAPASALQLLVAQALQLPPLTADEVLHVLHAAHPGELHPLAGAANLARRLPVDRAIPWSALLRERGLDASCPLRAIAADPLLPALARLQAAAVAYASFKDLTSLPTVRELLSEISATDDATGLLESVRRLSSQFADLLEEHEEHGASALAPSGTSR